MKWMYLDRKWIKFYAAKKHLKEVSLLHNSDEFLFTDFTITISVSFIDHFLEFFVVHGFTQFLGNSSQVLEGDSASFVIIEQSESLSDFFKGISFSLAWFRDKSRVYFFTILTVIRSRKSWNSTVPVPSLSTSAIILLTSSFLGSKPRALMATFNSLASILPEPSVSKRSKASLISCLCSSVSSFLPLLVDLVARLEVVCFLRDMLKRGWVLFYFWILNLWIFKKRVVFILDQLIAVKKIVKLFKSYFEKSKFYFCVDLKIKWVFSEGIWNWKQTRKQARIERIGLEQPMGNRKRKTHGLKLKFENILRGESKILK